MAAMTDADAAQWPGDILARRDSLSISEGSSGGETAVDTTLRTSIIDAFRRTRERSDSPRPLRQTPYLLQPASRDRNELQRSMGSALSGKDYRDQISRIATRTNIVHHPSLESYIHNTTAHTPQEATQTTLPSQFLSIVPRVVAGPSSEPSIWSLIHSEADIPVANVSDQVPVTASKNVSTPLATQFTIAPAKLAVNLDTSDTGSSASPRFISRLRRRLGEASLGLKATHLGRLMNCSDSRQLGANKRGKQPAFDSTLAPDGRPSQVLIMSEQKEVVLGQTPDHAERNRMNVSARAFHHVEVPDLTDVDQEVVTMNTEQRVELDRTATRGFVILSSDGTAITDFAGHATSNGADDRVAFRDEDQEHISECFARGSLLAGVGIEFGPYNHFDTIQRNDPGFDRQLFITSSSRVSEANTVVEGRAFAPPDLMREALLQELGHQAKHVLPSWTMTRRTVYIHIPTEAIGGSHSTPLSGFHSTGKVLPLALASSAFAEVAVVV
ncbi:hypothetical protein BU25DRAFT_480574 [Macroventuria anomochaeta]|uniref:Uncharacterized protein n=1 Tax=Macroventuria anomochaeta TaxID=301207 RepID=A0ACB6RMM1_9PLEO|nr:uncharacterized protein BU25DRAFT_480574 [Macroventuria anomochaeta]KAF2622557.1 hypothetical protein BU25DRAFT_480574 [Macroventuria anomochaeta]